LNPIESEVASCERRSNGLRALFAREEAIEAWLRAEAVTSYAELRADPSRSLSSADLRSHLSQLHSQRMAERNL